MSIIKTTLRLAMSASIAMVAAYAPGTMAQTYILDIHNQDADTLLRIPEISEQDCEKGLADLAQKLGALIPLNDDGKCVTIDNRPFAQFALEVPFHMNMDNADGRSFAEIFSFRISRQPDSGYNLSLKLNYTLDEIQQAIGQSQDIDSAATTGKGEYPEIFYTLRNGSSSPIRLVPYYVFVDGEPGLPVKPKMRVNENGQILMEDPPIIINHNESVRIRFSDVVSAYLAKGNSYQFATRYPSLPAGSDLLMSRPDNTLVPKRN